MPPTDLICGHLVDVPLAVAMPAGHTLSRKTERTAADLDTARLIVPPDDRPLRRSVVSLMAAGGAVFEVAMEARGWPLVLHFVQLGVGLGVINAFCRLSDGVVSRPLMGGAVASYHLRRFPTRQREPARELSALFMER